MIFRRRTVLALAAAPLSIQFFTSCSSDLYNIYHQNTLRRPFIAFFGRQGPPNALGHAFIGTGVSLDGELDVYERFFGVFSKHDGVSTAVKSRFTRTSGQINAPWKNAKWDTEIRRPINEAQRVVVLSRFDKWEMATPQYSLLANEGRNFNLLVDDIAASAGLILPVGADTTRPEKYIDALKAKNLAT